LTISRRMAAWCAPLLALVWFPFSAALAQEGAGRMVLVRGEVLVASFSSGPWVQARVGMAIAEGDTVATGKGARAALLFRDKTQVQLHGETRIQIGRSAPGAPLMRKAAAQRVEPPILRSLYKLLKGRVWLRAIHPVDWEVGSALVGVRGTDMGLFLDAQTGEAMVWVLSGLVHVAHPLGEALLSPGEQARMSPTRAPARESLRVHPVESVQWVLRHPAWVSPADVDLEEEAAWPHDLLAALEARNTGDLRGAMALASGRLPQPMAQLLMAWVLLEQGMFEEAEKRFLGVPSHLCLRWAGQALCRIQEGHFQEAKEFIQEGMAHCGGGPLLSCLWGVASLGMGQMEVARQALGSPYEEDKALPGLVLVQRALMALVWNEPDLADTLSERALRISPSSPTVQLVRAALLRSKGDLEGALEAASRALQRDPGYVPALIQAAELSWGLDRPRQAAVFLERAASIRPASPSIQVLKAYMDLASGETLKARQALEEALALDPFSSESHMGLGILEMRQGSPERALDEFLLASLVEPMASLPLSYLGKCLHQLGRFEEALGALERAAELDPMDPTPHLYRAMILRDLHRPAEAVISLENSMARNNGRCVYRSRFLLDQDRAVRNVDLAQMYKDLGLLSRARSHAILSVREDPTNPSAHLFLSTPFREEGKARAGIRELLKAQMLAPANANTFNTFHDYTLMFEGPRIQGELEGALGEHGLWNSNLFLLGGTSRAAGDLLLWAQEEKGFHRENNGQRDRYARTDWKISLDPSHELLLRWGSMLWAQGDHNGDADAEWIQDPYLHQRGYIHTATIGHRWHLGPREELLAYGIWSAQGFSLEDQLWSALTPALRLHMDLDWRFRQEQVQAGVLHMGRSGGHRWEWGVHGAKGLERLEPWVRTSLTSGGSLLARILQDRPLKVPTAMWELHAGDLWEIAPEVYLEGSLHFQATRAGQSPPVISDQWEQRACLGPRLGLLWKIGGQDLLRMGVARYLEPPYTLMEGLQPVEVAGFPLGEDASSGSLNSEARLGWDRSWNQAVFTHLEVGVRKHKSWEQVTSVRGFQARNLWDWRAQAEVEMLLAPTISLAGRYGFRKGVWEEVGDPPGRWPGESWAEHRGILEFRWVHPAGWRALIRETGVLQLGDLGPYGPRQEAFWTDLEVERFFWGRRFSVRLLVQNLLDQPFRLKTWELVAEKGTPARQVSLWVRLVF
jgi:tetratricopeptide (TPR) repeat protein